MVMVLGKSISKEFNEVRKRITSRRKAEWNIIGQKKYLRKLD